MATGEVRVSPDLTITIFDKIALQISSASPEGPRIVGVYAAELPALIAALTAAAEGMGMETVQAELVRALKLTIEYLTTIACDPNHLVLTELRAALAKAGQQ